MQLVDACLHALTHAANRRLSIKAANRALTHAARRGRGAGRGRGSRCVWGVGCGWCGWEGVTLTLVAAYVQANVTRSGGGVRRGYVVREGVSRSRAS